MCSDEYILCASSTSDPASRSATQTSLRSCAAAFEPHSGHENASRVVVPRMGLEPISLAAGNFKSPVYTIPPSGQDVVRGSSVFLRRELDRSQIFFSPSLEKFRDPGSLFCVATQNMLRPSILDIRRASALFSRQEKHECVFLEA